MCILQLLYGTGSDLNQREFFLCLYFLFYAQLLFTVCCAAYNLYHADMKLDLQYTIFIYRRYTNFALVY